MPELCEILEELDVLLLDMDGVIYLGDSPIEGAVETIEALRDRNKSLIFLTNNSTKTREEYVEKLSGLGITAKESEVVTSAYATARFISEKSGGESCYVIGENGLKEELRRAGLELLPRNRAEEASYVVVGMDRGLNYEKIWGGLSAILSGADFIATNPDPTYPTSEGLAPGAGASIGAISGTSEMKPSTIVGKPHPYMLRTALRSVDSDPGSAVIIGDRISTDIEAGKRVGLKTILVLSGVTDADKASEADEKPDFVMDSIKKLLER